MKAQAWAAAQGARASHGTFREAAEFGEIVVLSVHNSGVRQIVQELAPLLAGKIVIDTTNPLVPGPDGLAIAHGPHGESLGEQLQALLPQSKLVKAFNTISSRHMVRPRFMPGADIHIASNHDDAKQAVREVLVALGWAEYGNRILDFGRLSSAREMEYMCLAFVKHGIRTNDWDFTFRFVDVNKA